jgi:hypothetical protein
MVVILTSGDRRADVDGGGEPLEKNRWKAKPSIAIIN